MKHLFPFSAPETTPILFLFLGGWKSQSEAEDYPPLPISTSPAPY